MVHGPLMYIELCSSQEERSFFESALGLSLDQLIKMKGLLKVRWRLNLLLARAAGLSFELQHRI